MVSRTTSGDNRAWDELRQGLKDNTLSILNPKVTLLVKQAKDLVVSQSDEDGFTLLHYAAFYLNLEICEELVRAGAKLDAKNKYNETPLERANTHDDKTPSDDLVALLSGNPYTRRTPSASPPSASPHAASPPAAASPAVRAEESGARQEAARREAARQEAARQEAARQEKAGVERERLQTAARHKATSFLNEPNLLTTTNINKFNAALSELREVGLGGSDLARSLQSMIQELNDLKAKIKSADELVDQITKATSPITPPINSNLSDALSLLEDHSLPEDLPEFEKGLGDEKFLDMMKNAVNRKLLEKLSDYPIKVRRNNITDDKLRGTGATNASGVTLDLCDGVCCTSSDGNNEIIVRSTVADGYVLLDHG